MSGVVLNGRYLVAQAADDGFHTLTPCRLVDTRRAPGPLGGPELVWGELRLFRAVGACQIPDSAVAISVNAAVVAPTAPGHLRLFAAGTGIPPASTVNYAAGQTVTSPYDISGFDRCGVCYFVDVVAVRGPCESPLESDLGHPAPLGFSLLPCVP